MSLKLKNMKTAIPQPSAEMAARTPLGIAFKALPGPRPKSLPESRWGSILKHSLALGWNRPQEICWRSILKHGDRFWSIPQPWLQNSEHYWSPRSYGAYIENHQWGANFLLGPAIVALNESGSSFNMFFPRIPTFLGIMDPSIPTSSAAKWG